MLTALAANTWPARFTNTATPARGAVARAGVRKLPEIFHSFRIFPFLLFLSTALVSCDPAESEKAAIPKAWHVSTFAGTGGKASTDGKGTDAYFINPISIAQSGATLYVLQQTTDGFIRRVDINNAQVQTIVKGGAGRLGAINGAGTTALFNNAWSISAAGSTLYVADAQNHKIRVVTAGATADATQVRDLAGSGTAGHANGAGNTARFNWPAGVAVSGTTLYVSDYRGHYIRAVNLADPNKTVRDIAGNGTAGAADGTDAAQFNKPWGIATDGTTLYIADRGNHRIRAVTIASGQVRTLAGSTKGYADGAGAAAQFNQPNGVALSGKTLYIADRYNHCIRAVDTTSGVVTTIAGNGKKGRANGIGTAAQFNEPMDLSADGTTLYVAELEGAKIRKLEYR